MSTWERRIGVIDLYVEDVEGTRAFYEKVFGLPATRHPDCVDFVFADTIVHLRDVSTAAEFIAPAQAASSKDGSRGVFTIFVDDVDGVCAELADRGVTLTNGPADRWWGIRNACFADPSGQIWEIAGAVSADRQAEPSADAGAWDRAEKRIGNIVLFADDWQRAKLFYRDGFGLPVEHESHDGASFRFGDMTVGLLDIPGARELIDPAAVAGPAAGLRFTFGVFVDDVDAVCAELAERGVRPRGDLLELSFGHQIASFGDPAGHIWELVAISGEPGS